MSTAFFSDELTFWHSTGVQALFLPIGRWVQPPAGSVGADTPESKRRILNLLKASDLATKVAFPSSSPAIMQDLLRVHPRRYLDAFKTASDAGGGDLGDLAPFSQGGFEIAQVSAGLAKSATRAVLNGEFDNAYALCRPAGHHCLADRPMGFCLLANIPIAIEAAKAEFGVERVAVVDWDVHHGNGTQSIYYDRSDVLTISVHQDRCFPPGYSGAEDRGEGKGTGYNLNIPLPAGSGHETYLHAFRKIVVPALEKYSPDLIIVASGLDANAVDPLARMLLHSASYRELTALMMDAAARLCGGRLVAVHEGGYAEAYVPYCGVAILEAMTGHRSNVIDPELDFFSAWQPDDRMIAFHKELLAELQQHFGLA